MLVWFWTNYLMHAISPNHFFSLSLPVNLATGERCVQKEANLDVLDRLLCDPLLLDLFSEQFWQQHQVVILNPDQITVADNLGDGFGKQCVGLLVCTPVLLVERDFTGMVMEEWPQNAKNPHKR